MAVSRQTVPAWQRGKVASWLVTTDHKRIGILYISTSLVFFVLAGMMALAFRIQLAQANADVIGADRYNELITIHGTAMVFLVVVPLLAGFANYLVPLMIGARDVAFPRLNALSYWLFVLGGVVLMLSFFAEGGASKAGWTLYPPLSVQAAGQRRRSADPLAAHPHGLVPRRRDQLHRDHPQPADARDELGAPAAVRLVDRDLRGDPRRDPARALGGTDAAPPRPRSVDRAMGRSDELLQSRGGRLGGALPARVLVLRAPRGVRDHPACVRDHLGGPPGLRAQADLRLQGDRRLDRGDRVLLDARVGAPHVHGRASRSRCRPSS